MKLQTQPRKCTFKMAICLQYNPSATSQTMSPREERHNTMEGCGVLLKNLLGLQLRARSNLGKEHPFSICHKLQYSHTCKIHLTLHQVLYRGPRKILKCKEEYCRQLLKTCTQKNTQMSQSTCKLYQGNHTASQQFWTHSPTSATCAWTSFECFFSCKKSNHNYGFLCDETS